MFDWVEVFLLGVAAAFLNGHTRSSILSLIAFGWLCAAAQHSAISTARQSIRTTSLRWSDWGGAVTGRTLRNSMVDSWGMASQKPPDADTSADPLSQ